MSRQISFYHAEPDAVRFLQEIDRRGGTFWIGNAAVPPLSMIEAVQDKMSTHLCKFRIVPAGLAAACSASMPEAAIIEFCNCCRGNAMSRTYEVGRLYLVPACSGAYVPESATPCVLNRWAFPRSGLIRRRINFPNRTIKRS